MENEKKYPVSIIKAIHAVMTKVEYVVKDGNNEFHHYRYASEAALIAALRPVMLAEGLIIIPSGEELLPVDEFGITHIVLTYTLTHIDGDVWPDKIKAFGSGSDKSGKRKDDTFAVGDKGTYKAITGAYKYFIKNLFQIETGTDPEKDGAKKKKEETTTTTGDGGGRANTRKVTAAQVKRLKAIKTDFEWTDEAAKKLLAGFGYTTSTDIEHWEDYNAIVGELQKGMDGKAKADPKGYCIFVNGKAKEKK
jgi:hypothetical protein